MIRKHIKQLLKTLERPYEVYNRIEISRAAISAEHDLFSYTLLTGLSPDVRRSLVL